MYTLWGLVTGTGLKDTVKDMSSSRPERSRDRMEFNRPAFRLAQRLTMPALILAFIYMRMDVIMAVIGGSFR